MNKLLLLLIFLLPFTTVLQAQKVNDFLRPDVWLRADRLGNEPSLWEDVSGNGYHALPMDSAALSTRGLINFNNAIRLEGSGTPLRIPFNLSSSSQLTIITVYNLTDTVEERGIWGATINPGQDVFLSTQKSSGPQSIARYSEGNMNLPVVNTTAQYWGKAGDGVEDASMVLGGTTDAGSDLNPFSGDIAEFILFDRLVGGVELQIFQSYLALKYGATLQYSDYLTSTGDVVWDYAAHEEFSYAIAGIGRDDGFYLNQKQASNVETMGLLTIGAQEIASSNAENTYALSNGDYLVWGMNQKEAVVEFSEAEIYPYTYPVLERRWLMDVTGKNSSAIPTEIQFNVKDLIGEANQCYLVIDRSGTGDFASEQVEYIPTQEISGEGIARFRDIQWDTDKSGSDVFSLSFGMDNGVTCTHPICHNDPTGSIHIQVMGGTAPYSFVLTGETQSLNKEWTGESRFQEVDNLEFGDYRLVVTDGGNNVAQNKITITNPEEFTTGMEPEYTLTLGESLMLDAGENLPESDVTYRWESDNGFFSTSDVVTVTEAGEYTLTVTNSLGCMASETLSVKAPEGMFYHFQLYPNPSSGEYKLDVSLAERSPVTVRIYSSQGTLMGSESKEGAANYTFSGYLNSSGLYLVEIETSFGKEIFKLIVNND